MRNAGIRLSLLVAFWGAAAQASTLDFNVSPASGRGSVGYGGGATPLVGSGLGVASITGTDTPDHLNQELDLTGGQLNFVTGAFSGTSGGREWDFSPGGSIAVTGGIPALGIAAGSVLLSATFADTAFIRPLGLGDRKVEGAGFLNLVNPQLASYFGLPTGTTTYFGGLSAILNIPGEPGSPFSSDCLTSAHLVTSPVPEPRTIALYGLMLLGLTLWGRRSPDADRPA